jgi:hypothetical protein
VAHPVAIVQPETVIAWHRKGLCLFWTWKVRRGGTGLRRMISVYFSYYHETRPHLSLEKDSPEPRTVQPPELGQVVAVPQVGGLHHRYERCAA